jgi:signal transduction histidine kinase
VTLAAFAVAAALALRVIALRRRLDLVARAEHEIRGPTAALLLAVERMRREPAGRRHARALELQLARLRAALADLSAARRGRLATDRPARLAMDRLLTGAAGAAPAPAVEADPGRVAQALGNVLDNAAEHGEGPVSLEARRLGRALQVVVSNAAPDAAPTPRRRRGRGLRIARDAARRAGGRLEVVRDGDRVSARLELPLAGENGRRTPDEGDDRRRTPEEGGVPPAGEAEVRPLGEGELRPAGEDGEPPAAA